MTTHRWWIIIADRRRPMNELLNELSNAGLVVSHVLEAMGGITGSAEDQAAERLRHIPGVLNVWPDPCLDTVSSSGPANFTET